MTNKRFVSGKRKVSILLKSDVEAGQHTEGVTARELWLLGILLLELVADRVEQLDVALVRVLLEGLDKGPGHGTGGLRSNGCVGTVGEILLAWE